jgi:NAD-dependent SIR2 family protein deacetylase
MPSRDLIQRAAKAIQEATALLITAGAGMGVDSGLPDFRGPEGFWRAYPAYRALGLRFEELADPSWFERDPSLAWGFYGHRLNLYRATSPHAGFVILRRWSARMRDGFFVFTSNVDGQFQRAGFDEDRIHECHGTVSWFQCCAGCGSGVFPATAAPLEVDETTFRAREPYPVCPVCHDLARPNVLMFGDWRWDPTRSADQAERLRAWLGSLSTTDRLRFTVVESGAGTTIPTVRRFGEDTVRRLGGTLVRINPRAPDTPPGHVGLPLGSLEALEAIDEILTSHNPT